MVLFPIALIWVAAVLYFVIRRSQNEPEGEEQGPEPRRFRRPPGPESRQGRERTSPRPDRAGSRSRSS